MRFLVQGIGSIGQRHYKNILALGHEAAILRSGKTSRPFVQKFFDEQRAAGSEPTVFYDLGEAVRSFNPQALIVATPNHLHAPDARAAADLGLHLLIEKPLATAVEEVEMLVRSVKEKNLTVLVGYNLRFHPLLARVKEMIDTREVGAVLSATVEVGENIADWHPWEDYAETYAPWVKTGGGSLLCFSHDIDYLYWLLDMPEEVYAAGGKVTPLKGDAEDLVQALCAWSDGKTATLHIDYWSRPKFRTLKLICTKKTLLWDAYADLEIWDHESGERTIIKTPSGFERNDMFIAELKHFVECIEQGQRPLITLSEGADVVRLVDRIKKAL